MLQGEVGDNAAMNTTEKCRIFYCDRLKTSQCCAGCEAKCRCLNPCNNDPDRCGQLRPATIHELYQDLAIQMIDRMQADLIIEKRKPLGRYIQPLGACRGYIGLDNSTGDAWTEHFKTWDECVLWLVDIEREAT